MNLSVCEVLYLNFFFAIFHENYPKRDFRKAKVFQRELK